MRKLALTIVFVMAVGGAANAQTFIVNGGSVFNRADGLGLVRGNYGSLQIGARSWLSKNFELQATVTVLREPSVDAALRFRPFREMRLEPYIYTGFGFLFSDDDFRSVVPGGLGVEYMIDKQWGVHLEAAAMWTLARNPAGAVNTIFGISPSVGVSYKLRKDMFSRPPRTLANNETPVEPGGRAEVQSNGAYEPAPRVVEPASSGTAGPRVPSTRARGTAIIEDDMTIVPDGMFIMGLADEDPLSLQTAGFKRITVTGFAIDRFEISNADYRAYLDSLDLGGREAMMPDSSVWEDAGFRFSWSSYFRGSRYDAHPVVAITYDQALAYCSAQGKRLPTEAEWEYAARTGREGGIFPWEGFEARNLRGEYMANYNNGRAGYAADGYAFTAPVGAYAPNEWGLFNMSGNVAEWVEDAYSATYLVLSDFNPYHIDEAEVRRVVRGGSWASDEFYIGVGVRDAQNHDSASPYVGARCAMDLSDELFLARPARAAGGDTTEQQ